MQLKSCFEDAPYKLGKKGDKVICEAEFVTNDLHYLALELLK